MLLYMFLLSDWWASLNLSQQIFWCIAIVFSILFLIQFVLSLIGLDFDGDSEVGFEMETNSDAEPDFSLDPSFALLSVRSIIAFFTFFGWTGVLILRNGANPLFALGVAGVVGLIAMFIVAYMIYIFSKLTEEGNIDINNAVFKTGDVYLSIPANKNGYGKIHLNIDGYLRELDAVTDGDAIPTGAKVRVIEVLDSNILLVELTENLFED